MKTRQRGISPKLLADLLVSIATFLLAWQGVELEPEVAALVAKAFGLVAGVIVGPGRVEVERPAAVLEGRAR